MKDRIRIDTMHDAEKFVNIVQKLDGNIVVTDGKYTVNGKSLLGMIYAASTDFANLWVISDNDIYSHIKEFIIEASAECEEE